MSNRRQIGLLAIAAMKDTDGYVANTAMEALLEIDPPSARDSGFR